MVITSHNENYRDWSFFYTDCNNWSRTDKLGTILNDFSLHNCDSESLPQTALKFAKFLSAEASSDLYVSEDVRRRINKLSIKYKSTIEDFSPKLEKWLELRQRNIQNLQNYSRLLQLIKRATTSMALISSTLEVASGIAACMHRYFHFAWSLKLPFIIVGMAGGVSVTGSLLALSYYKQMTGDILRDLHEEKCIFKDLKTIHTRGNYIDDEVLELFPYGIDMNLVERDALNADEKTWKLNVSSSIILSTIKKNRAFIQDENFLESVKFFVESPAATMWFSRLKIGKLLDEMGCSLANLPDKQSISGSDDFLNHVALNFYPVLFPLFYDNGNMEKIRFLCSSMAAVLAIVNLGGEDDDDFENMKTASKVLLKDYKHIRKASHDLMSEYD